MSFGFQTKLFLNRVNPRRSKDTLVLKEQDKAFCKFERTARIHTIGLRRWRNKIMKLKSKKSIFFVNSSLKAIVHLPQKEMLT